MGLASYLSCVYDAFSSYRVSFSLTTSLTMMVLGPGHLVRALYHFPLIITLVVSVEYFQLIESQNPLVVSVDYFQLVMSVDYLKLT